MNGDTPAVPVRGRIDRDGRLIAADEPLAALHRRAGGADGGVIAIPQLAQLARLVFRLGIVVSRGVVAADNGQDLDLWVRAAPEEDAVAFAIVGWSERTAAPPWPAREDAREADFLASAGDWGWEVDEALRVVGLSPALAEILGVARASGEPLTQRFALVADPDGNMPMLDAVALHRRFEGQLAELRTEDARPVMLAGVPVTAAGGAHRGFRGVAIPVEAAPAPEPEAPEPVADFRDRLDAALRGPIGRIVERADGIRAQTEGPLRRDYADYAADIASAGRHLLALIDDLADLQAIERPDFRIDPEPVDMADLARRAAGLLAVRAADQRVRIDRPTADENLPALGDFRRALQILVNLIGNAVRYSPEGSAVWVRCEREDGLVAVIVADQGKGIAPEDQARIFEKFERVDPSEPGGTGLGLYIARRLAHAMGGDIAVDSAPGQGARFVFTLPGA